jgi:3-phosphoshikimate 1-carboxyvinyltransferase
MKPSKLRVKRAPVLETEITVPGDKSISHRAIMLAALSNGPCTITNFLDGEDCRNTVAAFRQLGVTIEEPEPGTLVVHGTHGKLTAPANDIDCGNSGTTMRLMAGVLAGQPFTSRLTGDASLLKRPMRRVIEPLSRMGAKIRATGDGDRPPLLIEGGPLQGATYHAPVASAQVKSAILLAGLKARGTTIVTEPSQSRDHTERMLSYFLVDLDRERITATNPPEGEFQVKIEGGQQIESRDFIVPGDISSAAFWLVAAAAQPGSRLLIKNVGLNLTRTGIISVLIRMGARIREVIEDVDQGEPFGLIDIKGCRLKGTVIAGPEIPNVIDEIPILAVAAALAEGVTIIRDAKELRVKESDRIAAIVDNLRAMGAEVEDFEDGMKITGGRKLTGARLSSHGDHRIAMAFAIAGLHASGETIIEDTDCIATSYPGFEDTLAAVRKHSFIRPRHTQVISSIGRRDQDSSLK